jgi:hypothetical protein
MLCTLAASITPQMKSAKVFLLTSLFFVTGLLSAMIFHHGYDNPNKWGANGLWAGGLFTLSVIIAVAVARQTPKLSAILIFAGACYGTYIILYFLTFITVWFGFVTGIVTGGIGSVAVFYLTHRFMTPLQYKTKEIFTYGGLAFLMNDLLLIGPISDFIKPVYENLGWVATVFAPVYLFWQTLVGYKLTKTLYETQTAQESNLPATNMGF